MKRHRNLKLLADSNSSIRSYFDFLGPRVARLIIYGNLVGFFVMVVEVLFAQLLQVLLVALGVGDRSVLTMPSWLKADDLAFASAALLGVGVFRGLLQWAGSGLQYATRDEFIYTQRTRIVKWAFHSDSVSTSQVSDLFSESSSNGGWVLMALQAIAIQLTSAILLYASLCFISLPVTLGVTGILAVLYVPLRFLDKRVDDNSKQLNSEWVGLNRRLFTNIKNLLLMQIYGTQEQEERKIQEGLFNAKSHGAHAGWLAGFKFAVPQTLGVAVICLLSYTSKTRFGLSGAVIVGYFYIFGRFTQNFSDVLRNVSMMTLYKPPLMRLFDWWKTEFLPSESRTAPIQSKKAFDGVVGWELSGINFQYPHSHKDIFKGFDLSIQPGKATVFTGASGKGKSTLLHILLGLLHPQAGAVSLVLPRSKSQPLGSVRASLLNSVGYVGPESFLLEGTVRSNLCYGLNTIPTDQELWEALEQAECQFLKETKEKLDHPLSEQGHGLSAGQKQRIALARALLRRPKVLILDEATSNLDLGTEARLVNTFASLRGKMTIVAVSHRDALSTIADEVVCL